MYRNVFIEHMKVPQQRGTNRTFEGHDFHLFSPTSIGWLDDNLFEQEIKSILHITPSHIRLAPSAVLHRGNMRNLLEAIFYNIDYIPEQADREKVWNVWNEIGGATPSFDVTAARLMRFVATSTLTIMDMISRHPEQVNLGGQQIAITP